MPCCGVLTERPTREGNTFTGVTPALPAHSSVFSQVQAVGPGWLLGLVQLDPRCLTAPRLTPRLPRVGWGVSPRNPRAPPPAQSPGTFSCRVELLAGRGTFSVLIWSCLQRHGCSARLAFGSFELALARAGSVVLKTCGAAR